MPIWLPQGALSGPYKERRASVLTALARQSPPLSQDTCFRVTIKGKEPRRASPRSSRSGQKPPCSRPSPPRNHVDQSFPRYYSACWAADTNFATATCGAIRLKLLKISAIVRFSVRRIGG